MADQESPRETLLEGCILHALKDRAMYPKELAKHLGMEEDSIREAFWNMLDDGRLVISPDRKLAIPPPLTPAEMIKESFLYKALEASDALAESRSHLFTYSDLMWIRSEAIREWTLPAMPFQFDTEDCKAPLTADEFCIYAIAFAAMRWMHQQGLVKDKLAVMFKVKYPDSEPDAEDM